MKRSDGPSNSLQGGVTSEFVKSEQRERFRTRE